jgi:type VI secretion system protein ImpH
MARKNGNKTGDVTLLREIQQAPWEYGFYSAVRMINCRFQDKARTGQAFRPSDDVIRFGQVPYTNFAPATLKSLEFIGPKGTPHLAQRFMGLWGPNGPMPTHLTEYARDRLRHFQDGALTHFADIFHHRAVSLFYRAWSQAQPTVQHDRPGQDRFSVFVGSIAGFGMPAVKDVDDMPHASKLHFAGHLSSLPRHALGLASMVESFYKVPAKVVEFIAHWLTIPASDRLQLGSRPGMGNLGSTTVLGEKVWQRQDKFQLCIGPLDLDEYDAFLPSGAWFKSFVALVRNYLGLELLWETRLQLKGSQKPSTCLGKHGMLGWTTWLETEQPPEVVEDLILQTENFSH